MYTPQFQCSTKFHSEPLYFVRLKSHKAVQYGDSGIIRQAPENAKSDTRLNIYHNGCQDSQAHQGAGLHILFTPRPIRLHQNHLGNSHEIHSHMLPARRLLKTKNYLNHADPRQTISPSVPTHQF
ncbi:hypothetical protein ACN42_g5398 [Penicillium freii]|uniref:Uncharacterized protein n=1 Tax=Penicillium freii TaxID=48697 RepID=A0A101MJP3_PENFR|nr:hypothetical protein ACN42_g5398 [Penicillium freii]